MGRGVHYHHCCGLYWLRPKCVHYYSWYNLVPLLRSNVECTLIDQMTQVDITQEYVNNESIPIEASYMFPLDERAAVCGFEAEIGGRTIVGKAKEKEQAKREYDRAVAKGDGAFLLEEKKADIFKIKVGNLLPGEKVKIKITYVAEMKSEVSDLKKRFLLPTTVAPRYTPPHDWREGESDRNFEPMSGAGKGYEMSINMSCHMMSEITAISSPSHSITHQINGKTASVGLSLGSQVMTNDFIVNIEVSQPHEPRVCLEVNESGDLAAMVTLFPHFQFRDTPAELVFVVDRSGSMGGSRIRHAREVMQLFMRSLPEDCFFNIVGFGSRHDSLYKTSHKYTDNTLREATNHISRMDANLGGTEMVAPLTSVFNSRPIRGYPRQVFVLTDGQVSNTERVIQLVEAHHRTNRVFTLGLGNEVSHHLVEGMARAGRGTAQFVSNGSDMAEKVMKQLKEAIQPALQNVRVDWGGKVEGSSSSSSSSSSGPQGSIVMSLLGYTSPEASAPPAPRVEVHQAPFRVPPLFDSQHFVIYAMYSDNKPPSSVKITAESPDGPLTVELPVDVNKTIRGKLIHTLAARSMIRDLEEGSSWMSELGYDVKSARVKDEIVRLGTKYQLASLHTSFIAIEERTGNHFDCWFDPYYQEEVVGPLHYEAPALDSLLCAAPAPSCAPVSHMRARAASPMCDAFYDTDEDLSSGSCSEDEDCEMESASFGALRECEMECAKLQLREERSVFKKKEKMVVKDKKSAAAPQKNSSARQETSSVPSVTSIAMEQGVNGSFPLTDSITNILSLDRATIQAMYSNFKISKTLGGEIGERIIVTALVIAFVEKKYAKEKGVWDRFVGKARGFLEKQLNGKGAESAQDILQAVSALL
uniref:von Willebrand factor A domain-containing protein 5A n=1 Tax=Paramoeba aestuarina TaxID=180227 RepID=A0A7S4NVN2_9EUKA|mmetsp:Transcript_29995/g.46445  ORF Transcript_29995/g.46445 Transcript_29995/m.46445 type:complete len:870 (+) Transcript_29995:190-2799(+)